MQSLVFSHPKSTPSPGPAHDAAFSTRCHPACVCEDNADHQFVAMLAAYRSSGGLAREAEVLAYIEHHCSADDGKLARSIADKHVISFEWQSQTWLPWFQFDRSDMSLQRGMAPVLAELNVVYDAWELAHWFARPNASLSQRAPADALALNFDAVLCTARADRFVNA